MSALQPPDRTPSFQSAKVVLGPVDKVWQPYLCGCQGEECREGFSCLVVSGRDAPELLETVEHPLDAVSIFVNPKVAGRRVLSVGFWRNDRPDTVDQEFFTQEVTVVAFVGEEQPRLRMPSLSTIVVPKLSAILCAWTASGQERRTISRVVPRRDCADRALERLGVAGLAMSVPSVAAEAVPARAGLPFDAAD